MYKFGDMVSVWPAGNRVEDWSDTADEFKITHEAVYSKTDEEDNTVCVLIENSEWFEGFNSSWCPSEWIHEPEYAPPSNKFIIECAYTIDDEESMEFSACQSFLDYNDLLEAQAALETHRAGFPEYTARLTYNGKVIG